MPKKIFRDELDAVWSAKLGFDSHAPVVNVLWGTLEPLLRESRADWTMFWRQLTYVARDFDLESIEYEEMIGISLATTTPYPVRSTNISPLKSIKDSPPGCENGGKPSGLHHPPTLYPRKPCGWPIPNTL